MDDEDEPKRIGCYVCNRTVSSVDQLYCKCRCEHTFCKMHRFPGFLNSETSHKCEYDFRIEGMKELQSHMPKIIADKISKI